MKRAYYSVLQYCPDPVRGESANVGVLVVGASAFSFRLLDRFGPLRQYHGAFDERVLAAHRGAVNGFFKNRPYHLRQPDGRKTTNRITREVLVEFTSRYMGPQLCYGPVCKVEGNIDSAFALETLREDLFEQFVLRRGSSRAAEKQRKERVKTILRNEFDACDFFNAEKYRAPLRMDQAVELPGHGYSLPVSFSSQGNVLHAFEPIDALDREGLPQLREVALVAMIFQKLRDEFGEQARLYACLVRPPEGPKIRELRILKEHAKVVDFSNKEQREKFFLALHKRLKPRGSEFLQF